MEPNLPKTDTLVLEKFNRLNSFADICARMPHIPVPQKLTSFELLCYAAELVRQKLSDSIIDNPMGSSNTELSNETLLQRNRINTTEVLKRYGNNKKISTDFDKHVIAYTKPSVNNSFINKEFSGK